MEFPQIERASMGKLKSFLSFPVSVVAMEMTSIILFTLRLSATRRPLFLVIFSDLAFAFFARYILNNYYPVRNVLSGLKLAVFLTLFYACVVSQGPLLVTERTRFSFLYIFNIFCGMTSCIAVQSLFRKGHYY